MMVTGACRYLTTRPLAMEGLEWPMLLFRERPDEVFYDIVRESLAGLAEDLKPALVNIEDAWQIGLPA